MNKLLLLSIIVLSVLGNFSVNAQESYEINCKMTVVEISLEQPFDVDDARQEDVLRISTLLIAELNLAYDKVNNNLTEEIDELIQTIDSLIESAIEVGMNYSMFDVDLEFINSLN